MTGIVETVPIPAAESMPSVAEASVATYAAPVYVVVPEYTPVAAPVYVEPVNNIKIAGNTVELVDAGTENVPDAAVGRYGEKFLFGHNSAGVFGGIVNLGAGNTFTVTYGGVSTTYMVQAAVVYEKVDDYTLRLNGTDIKMSVVAAARHAGVNYDMALMTCYGTSLPGRDATHRFVLFANRV